MTPIISLTTERLLLRQWRPEDKVPFAALNADPEVMEHFPAPLTGITPFRIAACEPFSKSYRYISAE